MSVRQTVSCPSPFRRFVSPQTCLFPVQDLVRLFDVYLTPLQKETFLSKDEVNTQR